MKARSGLINEKRPFTVNLTFYFFIILAAIWLTFSFYTALGGNASYANLGVFRWIMAGITFLAAVALFVLMILLVIHFKPAWILSVAMLAAMILAGFFDQIGWVDFLYMVVTAIPLILIIKDRKWYLTQPKEHPIINEK